MIDHFSLGFWTPLIAYTVSVIGSFIGLLFSRRARVFTGVARWFWLVLSAVCLGGTAVWSMHFIAMLGFQVQGTPIRYDALLTIASGLLAIVVMGVALYLTSIRQTFGWLLASGVIAGIGIASMHYMGMASMHMHGHMSHNLVFVVAATVIAMTAATVALWFAQRLEGTTSIAAAALLMGVAVSSMHYTGMIGVDVTLTDRVGTASLPGSSAMDLLLPLVVGLFVFLLVCSLLLMLGEDNERGANNSRSRRDEVETHG